MDSLARLFTRQGLKRRVRRTSAEAQAARMAKRASRLQAKLQRGNLKLERVRLSKLAQYNRFLKKQNREAKKRAWCQKAMRACKGIKLE